MRPLLNVAIAAVILLALIGYMVTFTVALQPDRHPHHLRQRRPKQASSTPPSPTASPATTPASSSSGPGRSSRSPAPTTHRVQILETALEQTYTNDGQTVDVPPLPHLARQATRSPSTTSSAATRRRSAPSRPAPATASTSSGGYSFDQLTNVDPARLKLDEAEDAIKSRVQDRLASLGYGITVEEVGIKRILLSPQVNGAVIERMRAERQRIAVKARSEGQAEGARLQNEAVTQAGIIGSFAQVRANQIEAEGRKRSAEYITRFAEDQDFAIFLAQLDALRESLGQRTRFILDTSKPPFTLLNGLLGGPADTASTRPSANGATPAAAPLPDVD